MTPGYQSVQPAHALAEFASTYPDKFKSWHEIGKNLIVLSTTNEKQLIKLSEAFKQENLDFVLFREPDIGDHATAIAVEPSEKAYKLVSSLPLALKDVMKKPKLVVVK